jgi:hypothetical protein
MDDKRGEPERKLTHSQTARPRLTRGFPGTEKQRAEAIRRLAEEHRETLRRLGQ